MQGGRIPTPGLQAQEKTTPQLRGWLDSGYQVRAIPLLPPRSRPKLKVDTRGILLDDQIAVVSSCWGTKHLQDICVSISK